MSELIITRYLNDEPISKSDIYSIVIQDKALSDIIIKARNRALIESDNSE